MLNLELARRNKKWTQIELSLKTRISQTFISAIETGKAWPTPDQRDRLARALDVPPELLLEEVPFGETPRAQDVTMTPAELAAYSESLEPVQNILAHELFALPSPIRTDHAREAARDLTLSLQMLHGSGRDAEQLAELIDIASLRLGTLLRDAGITWRGSPRVIERRIMKANRQAEEAAKQAAKHARLAERQAQREAKKQARLAERQAAKQARLAEQQARQAAATDPVAREEQWVARQAAKGRHPWNNPTYCAAWLDAFRNGERDYKAWKSRDYEAWARRWAEQPTDANVCRDDVPEVVR